ncbi:MAG: DUF4286 family protein [Gammaproteobacteria bacterium]|nr:DUF4286 family protein [Gammaproteobacteria bacterium]
MSTRELIYEVTLDIEPAVAPEFDDWLERHVGEMLALPGFERADLEAEIEPGDAPRLRRTVRYTVRDRAALDDYFEQHAARLRQAGIDRFGDRLTATRRVLETSPLGDHAHPVLPHCPNCEARLKGQYCARCGQRARRRMITLCELLRDVIGEIFQHDSRVWRSFFPLLFRPGFLTSEYLAGRQMRYVPPVRMYLFLSIVFFVIAFLAGPEGELSLRPGALEWTPPEDAAPAAVDETAGEIADETAAEAPDEVEATEEVFAPLDFECSDIDGELETGLTLLVSRAAIIRSCERLLANPRAFGRAVLANLPKMMFFFLPLLALVLKFMYFGSRRYYSEHLLFAVHFHAFFFLIVTLDILFGMSVRTLHAGAGIASVATAAMIFYIPWYLYRAMRNVYDQHLLIRLVKYLFLVVAYLVSLVIMLLITLAVTALTL